MLNYCVISTNNFGISTKYCLRKDHQVSSLCLVIDVGNTTSEEYVVVTFCGHIYMYLYYNKGMFWGCKSNYCNKCHSATITRGPEVPEALT